eukprot:3697972-Rhodomonas_salina.1
MCSALRGAVSCASRRSKSGRRCRGQQTGWRPSASCRSPTTPRSTSGTNPLRTLRVGCCGRAGTDAQVTCRYCGRAGTDTQVT